MVTKVHGSCVVVLGVTCHNFLFLQIWVIVFLTLGAIVDSRESEQAVVAGLQLARHIGLIHNITGTYVINASDVIDSFHNIRIGKKKHIACLLVCLFSVYVQMFKICYDMIENDERHVIRFANYFGSS